MAEDFEIYVDQEKVNLKLNTLTPDAVQGVVACVEKYTRLALSGVRSRLAGSVLNMRTGRLFRGAQMSVEQFSRGASGTVGINSSIPYARIQELGGTVQTPDIFPVHARALAFFIGGRLIITGHTRAHPTDIPARPYMEPTFEEVAPQFRDAMMQLQERLAKND